MLKTFVIALASASVALCAAGATAKDSLKGWLQAGSQPRDYKMSLDQAAAHSGKAGATIKCIAAQPKGFGTLMQTFKAQPYHGKRLRFSGYVRSEQVDAWAGLWMRVDGPVLPNSRIPEPLAFDNMQQRPIKGTTDWTKYEIVLEVPARAQEIAFGVLLTGKGQVWIDDLMFDEVGQDVPPTAEALPPGGPLPGPTNLDFEE